MRKILFALLTLVLVGVLPVAAGWDEGVAAFNKKDWKTAEAEFRSQLKQQPDSPSIHYMLGTTLQKLDRKEEALSHLIKAYDLDPNNVNTKLALGKAYSSARRYEEAARLLDSIDPGSLPGAHKSYLYQMRGAAKEKVGNDEGAFKDFRELAKLNPSDAAIQYNYGVLALKTDNLDTAVDALDRAVKGDPNDSQKKALLSSALLRKARGTQDPKQKKLTYLKASELAAAVVKAESTFENVIRLIEAQLGAGQYDQLLVTAKQAEAMNPRDWIVPFYVGQAYTSSDRYQQALSPLNKALELAGAQEQSKVWKQIGWAHEKLKNFSESISAYQKAGDQAGVARMQQNQDIASDNKRIEAENAQIEAMAEEAARLEAEMKKLEQGDGGGI